MTDQQNNSAGVVLFGDTGAGDNSFPKNKMQQPIVNAPMGQKNGVESAYLNADQGILSEIAEEDSVSMVSDRPKRLGQKSSEPYTPKDPITNSFIGSIRVSTTNLNAKPDDQKDEPAQISQQQTVASSDKNSKESKEDLESEPYKSSEEEIKANQLKVQKKNF